MFRKKKNMTLLDSDRKTKSGPMKKACLVAFIGTWIIGLVIGCYFAYQVSPSAMVYKYSAGNILTKKIGLIKDGHRRAFRLGPTLVSCF